MFKEIELDWARKNKNWVDHNGVIVGVDTTYQKGDYDIVWGIIEPNKQLGTSFNSSIIRPTDSIINRFYHFSGVMNNMSVNSETDNSDDDSIEVLNDDSNISYYVVKLVHDTDSQKILYFVIAFINNSDENIDRHFTYYDGSKKMDFVEKYIHSNNLIPSKKRL